MANYVSHVTLMASTSLNCPGDSLFCLVLAVVGIVCLAWGLGLMCGDHSGVLQARR